MSLAHSHFSSRYPVWFCDVWGVLHNGQNWFRPAAEALTLHRQQGGHVVLLTNSPRTSQGVMQQLRQMGVPETVYDLIVTSGDVTQDLVRHYGKGQVFYIGGSSDSDQSIFTGLDVACVPAAQASAVLCTGLRDDAHETLADYDHLLAEIYALKLPFICANPDKIIRRGAQIVPCAGALAENYAQLGGQVLMAGKPYSPIYDVALQRISQLLGQPVHKSHILAIGDGPDTDIQGASNYGLDVVLIADGVMDPALGVEAAQAKVQAAYPKAQIVATLNHLS